MHTPQVRRLFSDFVLLRQVEFVTLPNIRNDFQPLYNSIIPNSLHRRGKRQAAGDKRIEQPHCRMPSAEWREFALITDYDIVMG